MRLRHFGFAFTQAISFFDIHIRMAMGSPHEHWNRIHWIRIPDPDSMWSRVSSTQHADYAHCTAELDFGLRPCRGKVVLDADPRSSLTTLLCKFEFKEIISLHYCFWEKHQIVKHSTIKHQPPPDRLRQSLREQTKISMKSFKRN